MAPLDRRLLLVALASLCAPACATGGPGGPGGFDAGARRAPGADAGAPTSAGDCGAAGQPCCGGFCNEGLTCDPAADRCEAAGCGGAGQACCAEGAACLGALTCLVSGLCGSSTMTDAGAPASGCGTRGVACCPSDPPCGAGLSCTGGLCQDPPACGAAGQACCGGTACNSGLDCDGGLCRSAPAPTCSADGASCTTNGDCCNNSCMSNVCQTGSTGSLSACSTYATCGTCTDTPHCMWCGGCVDYDPLVGLLCAVFPSEC